jgi:hypothetical protein
VPHDFFSDQSYWSILAHELGCAPQPISLSGLTARQLATTIKRVIDNPEYYKNAGALAEQIRSEPGVKSARHLIERLLQRIGWNRENLESGMSEACLREREQRIALRKQFQYGLRSAKYPM